MRMLREREREDEMSQLTGFRLKFLEVRGSKLSNLFSLDLGKGKHCGRTPCPPCDSNIEEKRQNCRKQNILYESCCTLCNSSPQEDVHDVKSPINITASIVHPAGCNHATTGTVETKARTSRKGIYIGESSLSLQERSSEHVRDCRTMSTKSHMIKHSMIEHSDMNTAPLFKFTIMSSYSNALSNR